MKQSYQKPQRHSLKSAFQQYNITLNDLRVILSRGNNYIHQRLAGYDKFTEEEETVLQQLAESLRQETADEPTAS